MKKDLDALMQANQIDALMIVGHAFHNPTMVYMTGGGHITHATLIKKRGEQPVLYHAAMERDEAEKTGLQTRSYSNYPMSTFVKQAEGNYELASAFRYQKMLADAGVIAGRIALYGQYELGQVYAALDLLHQHAPELNFVGFVRDPLLLQAMMTKDEAEIERIRHMGKVTTSVVGRVADFLTSSPVQDEVLLSPEGKPLTIGDVKARINLWLAEAGAENPEATIFAIGRDAGVPHSSGNPDDVIRLGSPIVFDIFPVEAGGGYFYDFTRTWCLGYAPADVKLVHQQVKFVYDQLVSELEVNAPFKRYQDRTCEIFEEMNHLTIAKDPAAEEGYVHSLGHGVGLFIHERPFSGASADESDILAPGAVFTLEPGLYYPSKKLGVRIEDTFVVTQDGRFEKLADYPTDLVLPMKS